MSKVDEVGGGIDDYSTMLDTLDKSIEELQRKIENGRIRKPEHDRTRIKYHRALAYAINVRRQVTTDRDLEELAEEVEKLKEGSS